MLMRSFVSVAVLLFCQTSSARAQDTALRQRRDSLAVLMLQRRYPCPSPVPLGWVRSDSTNGSGLRCSLIAAAARGLRDAMATRSRPEIDPQLVLGRPRGTMVVRYAVLLRAGALELLELLRRWRDEMSRDLHLLERSRS